MDLEGICSRWSKLARERQIPYTSNLTYMWKLKKQETYRYRGTVGVVEEVDEW